MLQTKNRDCKKVKIRARDKDDLGTKWQNRRRNTMPFVENEGARIHYEAEGRGSPNMPMHGFSTDFRT